VIKITTIQVKFQVDKYKNIPGPQLSFECNKLGNVPTTYHRDAFV
jgi:hypothetical protein